MNDGGKGSTQRPFDHQKFGNNFDKIFGNKPEKRLIDMTKKEFNEALKGKTNDRDAGNIKSTDTKAQT